MKNKDKTILFLCSGGGGNLRFIHHAMMYGWIPNWQQIIVISDRKCPALSYASQNNLKNFCVNCENNQSNLLKTALICKPDIIITTFHKILCKEFVETFGERLINIHYSLLPSFAGYIGTKTVHKAVDYGVCLGGVTVHKVTYEVDAGQPLTQISFPFSGYSNFKDLMEIEFRAGCIALLNALIMISSNEYINYNGLILCIKEKKALICPYVQLPLEVMQENFWNFLQYN